MTYSNQHDEGDYRIYVGAHEAPIGGYVAWLIIRKVRGLLSGTAAKPPMVYADLAMREGQRWGNPKDALWYAMGRGLEVIRLESYRLTAE